jgi:hypothetical protein
MPKQSAPPREADNQPPDLLHEHPRTMLILSSLFLRTMRTIDGSDGHSLGYRVVNMPDMGGSWPKLPFMLSKSRLYVAVGCTVAKLHARLDAFQQRSLQRATAQTTSAYASKSTRQAY